LKRMYNFIASGKSRGCKRGNSMKSAFRLLLAITLALACCGPLCAQEQEKLRIVVMNFENVQAKEELNWLSFGIAESLTTKLAKVKSIVVVERAQLAKILGEQRLQQSGFVDTTEAVEAGKLIGAKSMVVGSFQVSQDKLLVSCRLVNVESGEIEAPFEVEEAKDNVSVLYANLATQIIGEVNKTGAASITLDSQETQAIEKQEWKNWDCYKEIQLSNIILFGSEEGAGFAREYISPEDLETAMGHVENALSIEPGNAHAYFNRGLIQTYRFKWNEARQDLEKAVSLEPSFDRAVFSLGVLDFMNFKFDDAKRNFEKSLQINPNFAEARFGMAYIEFVRGRYDEAERLFKEAIEKSDQNSVKVSCYVGLARHAYLMGRLDDALSYCDKAAQLAPYDAQPLFARSEALEMFGRYDDALAEAKKGLDKNPGNTGSQLAYALSLTRAGRADEGLAIAQKVAQSEPTNANAHLQLATIHMSRGESDDAIYEYKRALEIKPGDVVALNGLGYTYIVKKDYAQALDNFNRAKSIWPEGIDTLLGIGRTHADQQKWDEAIKWYKQAQSLSPKNINVMCMLGEAYALAGKSSEAWAVYKQADVIAPSHPQVLSAEGYLLFNEGKYPEAEAKLKKLLEVSPNDRIGHNFYAWALFKQGKNDDALYHFRRAIEIDPKYADAYFGLGQVYQAKGDAAKAKENLDKAVQLDPAYGRAAQSQPQAGASPPASSDLASGLAAAQNMILSGNYAGAVQMLIQLDAMYPNTPEIYHFSGAAYILGGDLITGSNILSNAVNKWPSYAPPYYWLGIAFETAGDLESAYGYYSMYLELAPDGEFAEDAGERMENIEDAMDDYYGGDDYGYGY